MIGARVAAQHDRLPAALSVARRTRTLATSKFARFALARELR
jgi:hypothetical protein